MSSKNEVAIKELEKESVSSSTQLEPIESSKTYGLVSGLN